MPMLAIQPDSRRHPTAPDLPAPDRFTAFHPFIRGVFSQWHLTSFCIDGVVFNTAEQWMMVNKAILFGDRERATAIMGSDDPAEQKRLGQMVRNFDGPTWDRHKVAVVHEGNAAKFAQNRGAARQLMATAPAMLVEANPRDWVWGCGLAVDDPRVATPAEWPGENLLGRVLTSVREQLAAES